MTDDWLAKQATDNSEENCEDSGLKSVLREWKAPEVPLSLDARVLDSYRRKVRREPFWRRFFTTSVRVPLPVAIAVMAVLVIALALAMGRSGAERTLPSQYVKAPVDQPIVVSTSLAGFQPVEEVNVSVVTERAQ